MEEVLYPVGAAYETSQHCPLVLLYDVLFRRALYPLLEKIPKSEYDCVLDPIQSVESNIGK